MDVLIIGAGLAGLTCARHLQRAGRSFRVLEAADAVGGRVRTDVVDGFRLDRGFQVLLTAYPETRRELDYDALDLRTFYSGALVYLNGRFHRLADPLRHPRALPATLFAPVGTLADKFRVGRLALALLAGSLDTLFSRPEMTTVEALRRRWGFSDSMIDPFFRSFLGGILLDHELHASSRMAEFVFRMFTQGRAALPAAGMQAIPDQLAAPLPPDAVWTGTRVASLAEDGVVLADGRRLNARAVVVAVEAPEAARLLGTPLPTDARSVTTLYFAAPEAPVRAPILVLDGDGTGPVNNLSVQTNVAPSYGPPGAALVSVAVLGDPAAADDVLEGQVRAQLTAWFGAAVARWRHLRTYRIRYALPEQAPPFLSPPERPVRLHTGRYVCGDHRRTGSINGAMAAGRHAAEAVAADLAWA